MITETIIFLCIGAFVGGFVNGFAGFGTSLFALGWLLQVLPPIEAVSITLILSLVSGVQGIILVWHNINWKSLARFLIPASLGVPVGIQLLAYLDASLLMLIVAVFLIVYGGYFSFKNKLPNLNKEWLFLDAAIGFLGGIFGALGGLSGVLPTILCSMRPWPKMRQRALIQPFNVIILLFSATLLFINGAYTSKVLQSLAIATPVTLTASIIGIGLFKRVSDLQFRRLLIFLMLISGVVLIVRLMFSA